MLPSTIQNLFSRPMLLSTKVSLILPLLIFKGRIPSKKIRIRSPFSLIPFSLTPPIVSEPISLPSFSEPESSVLSLKPTIEQTSEPVVAPKDRMTGKMFLRKKAIVFRLMQVQESKLTPGNEGTVSYPPLQTESKLHFERTIDQNLLIAIRKGTKECIKHPFVSTFLCCIT